MEKNAPILGKKEVDKMIASANQSLHRHRPDPNNDPMWLDLEDETLDSVKFISDDPDDESITYYGNESSAFGFGDAATQPAKKGSYSVIATPVTLQERSMKVIRGEVPDLPLVSKEIEEPKIVDTEEPDLTIRRPRA